MKRWFNWFKSHFKETLPVEDIPVEVTTDSTKSKINPPAKELEKHRLVIMRITFKDKTEQSFLQAHPVEEKVSYIKCYRHFYTWFWSRPQSQWFRFSHKDGANIFCRDDIKRIDFKYEITDVKEN